MDKEDIIRIQTPQRLATTLECFQYHCVPECCGLDAFAFAPVFACHAISVHGLELVRGAVEDLDELVLQIHATAERSAIDVVGINALLSKDEALEFLKLLRCDLILGISIGPIAKDDKHPLNEAGDFRSFESKASKDWTSQPPEKPWIKTEEVYKIGQVIKGNREGLALLRDSINEALEYRTSKPISVPGVPFSGVWRLNDPTEERSPKNSSFSNTGCILIFVFGALTLIKLLSLLI